jgi:hypothetical protein
VRSGIPTRNYEQNLAPASVRVLTGGKESGVSLFCD